ncbi:MAG: transcriptional regulator [Deltaproteobacteria bacterium]|nr:transcriptional regulator [Deltaproteobacteria bacterium]
MARGDQLGRQWKIIQTLITAGTGKSAAELASELDIHPRTVYRDLVALQTAGFPIYTERTGSKSLWSLLDTVKHHIPVPFSLPELMALYFGGSMLKVFKGTFFYDALESLARKIRTTLPPESLKYLKTVEQTMHVAIKPYKDYARFRGIIERANEAATKRRTVEIVYYTMSRRKETKRKVDPYRVWFFNGTFYLIGHCHMRDEVRIFALDRVKMLHQMKEFFDIPEGFSLEEFMGPSFGVFQGSLTKVKIWFSPDVAGYVKEKIWHRSQEIHEQGDGSVVFEAEIAGTDEIRFWVMGWGSHAEVLEPEDLREQIRIEAEAILNRYGRGLERQEMIGS